MKLYRDKKGRRGDLFAKDRAAEIVRDYRDAQAQPDGIIWATYEDDGHSHLFPVIDASNIEPLLKYLENFAETGYFDSPEDDKEINLLWLATLRIEYKFLTTTRGYSRSKAIGHIAKKHKIDDKTIGRRLTDAKKRLPKS